MNTFIKSAVIALIIGSIQGCASVSSADRNYRSGSSVHNNLSLVEDITFSDNEKKIQALLNYNVRLPEENRIAILKPASRYGYSNFNTLNDAVVDLFIGTLRSSDRVFDASYLPAMLTPPKISIPALREAAARFQADLLLIYRDSCNSYSDFNFVDPNQARSYCSVEAALLDVRSGIIVKSVISTEEYTAPERTDNFSLQETIRTAEAESTAKALKPVAEGIVSWIEKIPVINPANN